MINIFLLVHLTEIYFLIWLILVLWAITLGGRNVRIAIYDIRFPEFSSQNVVDADVKVMNEITERP